MGGQAACAMCGREEAVVAFEYEGVYNKAVISLARIRIHKFTKGHSGTVPIGWCLLCICFLCVVLLATWATQMCKCANAQIAVPA